MMANRLDRIQYISGLLRYLLLFAAAVLSCAIAVTLLVPGQEWVTLGDGHLNKLYSSGAINLQLMLVLITPVVIVLALGIYWLQRLFSEYQQGHFFTDGSMRCYVWLVWLKATAFVYSILWPLLLNTLAPTQGVSDVALTVEAGTLGELIVLILIVHLLKEAQQIHDENKAFI